MNFLNFLRWSCSLVSLCFQILFLLHRTCSISTWLNPNHLQDLAQAFSISGWDGCLSLQGKYIFWNVIYLTNMHITLLMCQALF